MIFLGSYPLANSITSDSLKTNSFGKFLNTSAFEPITKVFALADVKRLKLMTSVYDGLDSNTGDSNATSDG